MVSDDDNDSDFNPEMDFDDSDTESESEITETIARIITSPILGMTEIKLSVSSLFSILICCLANVTPQQKKKSIKISLYV